MRRRRFLASAGTAGAAFLAGCLNDPGRAGGILELYAADVPAAATVAQASDDRIRDVEPIVTGLDQVHREGDATSVVVTSDEYEAVADALAALPWYDRLEDEGEAMSGNYVRYDGATYVVVLTPICSDTRLWTAYAERGTYGWGGCFDYEGDR